MPSVAKNQEFIFIDTPPAVSSDGWAPPMFGKRA
jgi:hypothetical protein